MLRILWIVLFTCCTLFSFAQIDQQRAEQLLRFHHDELEFDGAVLMAQGDQIIFQQAIGQADREADLPLTVNSKFRIASITKAFTAVLVMQLIEEGKFEIDDSVAKVLPELRIKGTDEVSIREVLMHYSGIGVEGKMAYTLPYSLDLMLSTFGNAKLKKPGENFTYSNLDYILLSRVVEKYRDMTYEEALHKYILVPTGMMNSGLLAKNKNVEGLVKSYQKSEDAYYEDVPFYIENMQGAGAMYSTLSDLFRFDRALQSFKLLSEETMELMYTPREGGAYVACGSWVYTYPFVEEKPYAVERRGGILGSNTLFMRFPKANKTLIMLNNNGQFDPDKWGDKANIKFQFLQLLFGETPDILE